MRAVGVQLAQVEADALEELPGDRIGVLIGVEDVGAVAVEQLRERRDEPFAIRARDEQGRGFVRGLGHARTQPSALTEGF